eukprot:TRINITY_DN7934_c0_g2_i2.p1 TRINITY_DN7934_c0_g2~~TRINITY_DN7934_c0_g2_i2.p1  ORF type:complete len:375 (-),score=71.45 TRINITY_DN7934_c0_g2_i2:269-1393(-)
MLHGNDYVTVQGQASDPRSRKHKYDCAAHFEYVLQQQAFLKKRHAVHSRTDWATTPSAFQLDHEAQSCDECANIPLPLKLLGLSSGPGPAKQQLESKEPDGERGEGQNLEGACSMDTESATTLLIRHIPCRVVQSQLVDAVNSMGFDGKYDLIYLPLGGRSETVVSNLGYGFINMLTVEDAKAFATAFEGYRFKWSGSQKVCAVRNARIQGFRGNLINFAHSSARHRALNIGSTQKASSIVPSPYVPPEVANSARGMAALEEARRVLHEEETELLEAAATEAAGLQSLHFERQQQQQCVGEQSGDRALHRACTAYDYAASPIQAMPIAGAGESAEYAAYESWDQRYRGFPEAAADNPYYAMAHVRMCDEAFPPW